MIQEAKRCLLCGTPTCIDACPVQMDVVFAAGDVTTSETLVVKAMGSGRDAAQRIHEYHLRIPEGKHVSLYERYFVQRSFEVMSRGQDGSAPP